MKNYFIRVNNSLNPTTRELGNLDFSVNTIFIRKVFNPLTRVTRELGN